MSIHDICMNRMLKVRSIKSPSVNKLYSFSTRKQTAIYSCN